MRFKYETNLLVFRNEIVHVALGFSEFHLVHALTSVPMEESLPSEHSSELLTDPLEEFLENDNWSIHLQ